MAHERRPDFGYCGVCKAALDEEEYHLGLGRCRACSRKCDEEVGFGTKYGNTVETETASRTRANSAGHER